MGVRLGSCSEPVGELAEPLESLTSVASWVHVGGVEPATRAAEGSRWTFPATVVDTDGKPESLRLHASFWSGIGGALASEADVCIAVSG